MVENHFFRLFQSHDVIQPIQSLWIPGVFYELAPPERFANYVRLRKNMKGGWRRLIRYVHCSVHFSAMSHCPPPVPGAMNLSRFVALSGRGSSNTKMITYDDLSLFTIADHKHYAPFRSVQNPMGIDHKGRGGWDVTKSQEKKICDAVFRWEDSHSVTKKSFTISVDKIICLRRGVLILCCIGICICQPLSWFPDFL